MSLLHEIHFYDKKYFLVMTFFCVPRLLRLPLLLLSFSIRMAAPCCANKRAREYRRPSIYIIYSNLARETLLRIIYLYLAVAAVWIFLGTFAP